MQEIQSSQSLEDLLDARADLWRGRHRPVPEALGTGRDELDAWLPSGGWPRGRLIELLPAHFGLGELDLLLPLLAEQTRRERPVLFAAPPLVPCPQSLCRAGLALDHLVIVRASEQALWAAEQGLKSGLCGAIVLWHPRGRIDPRAIRRLQLAAENGEAPVFVSYAPGQQPPPSLATLRLAIQPGPELVLLRGGDGERRLRLGRENVIALDDWRRQDS